jgi:hypothetical protein
MSETKTGKFLAELDFAPAVIKDRDGNEINLGTMWFDPPGHRKARPQGLGLL